MYQGRRPRLLLVDTANHPPGDRSQGVRLNAMVAGSARTPMPPRLAGLNLRGDRLVVALVGYRTSLWAHDEAAPGANVDTHAPAPVDAQVDAATERARAREWIRAVQSVKARRRRQKLGAVGGRRMP